MADEAHIETDRKLEKMERHLSAIYRKAEKETGKAWKEYLASAGEEISDLQKAYDDAKKSGDAALVKKAGFRLSRAKQERTLQDKRFRALTEQLAVKVSHVNETALAYVNGELPGVYALNYNALEDTVSGDLGGYSFTLTDANTVKSLAESDKNLLPYKEIDGKKDVRWNVKKINAEVLQGIIQGESMDKIAGRFSKVMAMDQASAIRNARTTVTGAENRGRQDSYVRATSDGIQLEREWISTSDGRTRHAHALLDGQTTSVDKPFKSELGPIRFPGDPEAAPANVYNCRCTIAARVIGFAKKEKAEKQIEHLAEIGKESRIIYSKNTPGQYSVVNGDIVQRTSESVSIKDGKRIITKNQQKAFEAPANPSEKEAIIFQMGNPAPRTDFDRTENAILSHGRIALNYATARTDTRDKAAQIVENEIYALAGVRKRGTFYRAIDNKKEAEYIKTGKIRPSVNHMTGEKEEGLSVWEIPKYSGEYIEELTGEIAGIGSDGEPLLDVKTIKLVSVNKIDVKKAKENGMKKFAETYNWTQDQIDSVLKRSAAIKR